jgi:hypothetical protein
MSPSVKRTIWHVVMETALSGDSSAMEKKTAMMDQMKTLATSKLILTVPHPVTPPFASCLIASARRIEPRSLANSVR